MQRECLIYGNIASKCTSISLRNLQLSSQHLKFLTCAKYGVPFIPDSWQSRLRTATLSAGLQQLRRADMPCL
jgi:hypothetical protein